AAARQGAWWRRRLGGIPGPLGINISPRAFSSALVDEVRDACDAHDVEPSMFSLELPESLLSSDVDFAHSVLGELSEVGVRLAIDEFGTGAAGLGQLRQLPVDTVKMDRTLVRMLANDGRDQAIVDAAVSLAGVFDLRIVAVGVESES